MVDYWVLGAIIFVIVGRSIILVFIVCNINKLNGYVEEDMWV